MTKEQAKSLTEGLRADPVKYWFPIILGVLSIATMIWSSSGNFQALRSKATGNESRIERLEERFDKRIVRIEDKIDMLLSKVK